MREAVLLLYMGSPSSPSEVRDFLYRLFSDRDLINFGVPPFLQKPLAWLVSLIRAPFVSSRYRAIGGSPLVLQVKEQAELLEKKSGLKVFVGMLYSEPFLEETAKKLVELKPKTLYVLTLYPHYSRATVGACLREVKRFFEGKLRYRFVRTWHDNPFYLEWIRSSLEKRLEGNGKDTFVLFSAHSIPEYLVREGDPYKGEIEATVNAVMKNFPRYPYMISYQSRVGPIKWLEPSTETALKQIAESGFKRVVVFPVSFTSEHIETLYELDVEYRRVAEDLGLEFDRVPIDYSSDLLIEALAEEVRKSRNARR